MREPNEMDPMGDTTGNTDWIDSLTLHVVVADTWDTYLGATATPMDAENFPSSVPDGGQIEARIRISGNVVWEMTLLGSWNSAEEATRRMLGTSCATAGPDAPEAVLDAWGELVNTLAGNVKASLRPGSYTLSIPQISPQRDSAAESPGAVEHSFEWDGHLAMIRVARITSA